MADSYSIHCPQCGTPVDIEISADGRLRTRGCVYTKQRFGHGEVADDAIIAQVEAEHPVFRGVRFYPAPKALRDRQPK